MPYSLKTSTPMAVARRSRPASGQGSAPNRPMRSLVSLLRSMPRSSAFSAR